jgi:predicted transcriptional regulator
MAKQNMTIRIGPEIRSSLDALAAAEGRDRSWIVNQAISAYIEAQSWPIGHIQHGLREADAGKFASAREVKLVVKRLRRSWRG